MELLDNWQKAQPIIKDAIGASSYDTWFASLNVKEKKPDTIIIETPDEFYKNWIIEHFYKIINKHVNTDLSQKINIEFDINPELNNPQNTQILSPIETNILVKRTTNREDINLNKRFTFESFVVGPSNRFAYAASQAVAESPSKAYNPLFIYGQVGLGKTHLMQSITHHIKSIHPDAKCVYLSSEKFTNELINAIRHRSTPQFRQKYRNMDVLLIDDIHFIAGKESTQEEFFHTFNALHNSRKQIIICSDRPPQEISNLEERLRSRFAWGLITDIQPPDFETRVAILRKKSERESVVIPDNVIDFIADQIKTNIRELEGALIRVVAYSLLEEKQIHLDMAKVVLKDMVKQTVKTISIEMIQKSVSDLFHISLSDLKGKRRSRNIILPRQIAMFLTRQLTNSSFPEIGNAFGGKDHTTIMHSCRKINKEIQDNRELRNTVEKLTTSLKQ
ncbi:MAG: chromosomal replication initiator protein DnaA [Candidatus Omnitrophica bacterium]|nr:chromosomal replication initiator protein DnaA [Candidatus Omnitrophota bacterium]